MLETNPVVLTRQHEDPTHTIIHISDTQLLGENGAWHGYPLDADDKLDDLVKTLEETKISPDAIIFTGDLADKGEPEAYRKLRNAIEPLADNMGAELIWGIGNHDKRDVFRSALLYQQPSMEPIDEVRDVNGLRIISLDTTVPGHHYGLIADGQLEWLADVLATPAEHGTILAMHHPPIPVIMPLALTVELQDQAGLAAVIKGTDIRSIIAGHLHYSSFGSFAGIPVSVASSSCYSQDLAFPESGTRGRNTAQAFNLIHVYKESVMHTVVPLGESEAVGETVKRVDVEKQLAAAGIDYQASLLGMSAPAARS
jgi:3',5'-cyclic AMP phosphodiesterase CpdA